MNWTDPLFLCSGITGVSLVIATLIFRKFPAREINDLYGYRTRRSRMSQEAWDFSQIYSGELMIWVGIYNCLLAVLGLFISFSVLWGLLISMLFLGASCFYLFWKTEGELKKRFGE